eukprot:304588-Pyramimonas_sp.AAC.2
MVSRGGHEGGEEGGPRGPPLPITRVLTNNSPVGIPARGVIKAMRVMRSMNCITTPHQPHGFQGGRRRESHCKPTGFV